MEEILRRLESQLAIQREATLPGGVHDLARVDSPGSVRAVTRDLVATVRLADLPHHARRQERDHRAACDRGAERRRERRRIDRQLGGGESGGEAIWIEVGRQFLRREPAIQASRSLPEIVEIGMRVQLAATAFLDPFVVHCEVVRRQHGIGGHQVVEGRRQGQPFRVGAEPAIEGSDGKRSAPSSWSAAVSSERSFA